MSNEQNNINSTLDCEFWNFINDIKNCSSDYDYVCVRGKRCFNIMAAFLPDVDFITFSALMLKYKELVDYYQKNKRFPKILLIDDLIYNGRGMARDLQQLEDTLAEEFLDRKILNRTDNYLYHIYLKLTDSLTISVYDKSVNNLFIDRSHYLETLDFKKESYYDELRDYTLRLGEKIKQWDIANTDCTYSARTINEQNDRLEDIILKQQNGRIKGTKWVRQEGIHMGEPIILYTRLNGNESVNRVDTIRYFPNRIGDLSPLISSYSFFGALSENTSYQLISDVRDELKKAGLNKLAEVLKMSDNEKINRILLESKMQLITFILSQNLFYEFCLDMVSVEHPHNMDSVLNKLLFRGDRWKCVRNFGKKTDLVSEFTETAKKDLRKRLGSIILNVIDSNADELIPFNPDDVLNDEINTNETNLEKITDIMRNVLFRIEMQSRKLAYELDSNKFDASSYQTNISVNEPYGHDGFINFNQLFKLEEINHLMTSSNDIYSLIFATIGLVDNYHASLRLKSVSTPKGDAIVQNCIITHEQAGFYLPEKFSSLIESLAEMESNIFGSPQARLRYFRSFILGCVGIGIEPNTFHNESLEIIDDIKKAIIEEVIHLSGEENLELALKKIFGDVERFYCGGFSFNGFNFDNLKAIARQRSSSSLDIHQLIKYLNDIGKTEWGDYWIQSSSKDKDRKKKYKKDKN